MMRWGLMCSALLAVASAQDGCKLPATLTAPSGTIFSPYYNHFPEFSYLVNLKCRWTVTVPDATKNVRITFANPIAFESNTGCTYDWVAVLPAGRPATTTVCQKPVQAFFGPYCPNAATPAPAPFVVAGNTFDIEFCTDSSTNAQGFQLTYETTSDPADPAATIPPSTTRAPLTTTTPLDCDRDIVVSGNTAQFIESPNYPGQYPDNIRCTWTITGDVGGILEFTSLAFNTESGYDILTLTDLSGDSAVTLGTFQGTTGPQKLRSNGNSVRAVFVTDSSSTRTGFRIRIQTPKCAAGQGSCPNTGAEEWCFSPDQLCDGTPQCPGGTDEFCPPGCGTPVKKPILSTRDGQKIVGGIVAKPHSWPWQVSMIASNHICGGSIIDHHWVVTAAHCCAAVGGATASTFKVRVGEHDILEDGETNAWTYELERFIMHPLYNPRTIANDICLLKTKMPIFFNDDVSPVCLGSGSPPPVGTDCFVTGWGSTAPNRMGGKKEDGAEKEEITPRVTDPLRQVDVKVVDQEVCKVNYAPTSITNDMICGYNPGKDSCQGDSGGPFVCPSQNDPNTWELVGVVSWGSGCARPNLPGVYARVSHFLDWISETIFVNSKK